jgi:protein MYSM1
MLLACTSLVLITVNILSCYTMTVYFTVSQTEASERLHDEGLEVVGWYHSHPTFFPNPSLQDLDTQSHMQDWFAKAASAPLVGFILSPYCPTSRTSASEYRWAISK